jgi:hypothetical protein
MVVRCCHCEPDKVNADHTAVENPLLGTTNSTQFPALRLLRLPTASQNELYARTLLSKITVSWTAVPPSQDLLSQSTTGKTCDGHSVKPTVLEEMSHLVEALIKKTDYHISWRLAKEVRTIPNTM